MTQTDGGKGIYNVTPRPASSVPRVCLFCRKNRSFVTAAPIYISSPQRLSAVTNVPAPYRGPSIPASLFRLVPLALVDRNLV